MRRLNEKGEGKANYIIGFIILFLVIYAGFKFIPVMIQVYAYADKVNEECTYLHGRKIEELEFDIRKQARIANLPVDDEDVNCERVANQLRCSVDYTVQIVTPVKVFNWDQHIRYDAPIFE
jgi:hypothetical protein